ncbi:MAG: bifunctional 3,4-dihydroxy-2-butanone-4-phosphate synthase/GTP cyclohydrolase II [Chloroflexota bacterium]
MPLLSVEEAIERYRRGEIVIIVDDEDRENEGDLCVAAEKATPEAVNFMAKHGRGLICLTIGGRRLDELRIPMMVQHNTARFGTAFTVSIEAKHGVTTGISAYDRAVTIQTVLDPATKPEDIAMPGHVFPLRAREGGVLVRAGQTEASVDLAKLAGLYPAGVICEVMNDDGTMARMPQLAAVAAEHGLGIVSVAQLIEYRGRMEKLVSRVEVDDAGTADSAAMPLVNSVAAARLPTRSGEFRLIAYENTLNRDQHVALVMGDICGDEPVLVRVHSECLTGDVFGSLRCDCGQQLAQAMTMVREAGSGVILYMRQEGRGIGLHNKVRAYALQDQGLDTVEANERLGFPADLRDYGIGAQILVDLGLRRIRLLTNNPRKVVGLQGYGLEVVERVPLIVQPNPSNEQYLLTKKEKLGHLLEEDMNG